MECCRKCVCPFVRRELKGDNGAFTVIRVEGGRNLRLDKIDQFGVDFIIDSTQDFEQSLYGNSFWFDPVSRG